MTKTPPLLPEETLARVHRLARMDGMSVLAISSVFAVLAAMQRDFAGTFVGLAVAGAGAIELHGTALLRDGRERGMNWLVASQLFLLASILTYCAVRLQNFEIPTLPPELRTMVETTAEQLGMTPDRYVMLTHRTTLWMVAGLSTLYQGGMALYYFRRRDAVARALVAE